MLARVAESVSAPSEPTCKQSAASERVPVPAPHTLERPSVPDTSTPTQAGAQREHAEVEARRQARYARVVALAEGGCALREGARRAGGSRGTERSYLRAGQYRSCATRSRRPHGSDTYAAYLWDRWGEGERNSAQLVAETRAGQYRFGFHSPAVCRRFADWSMPPDRELYLPGEWIADPVRRYGAGARRGSKPS